MHAPRRSGGQTRARGWRGSGGEQGPYHLGRGRAPEGGDEEEEESAKEAKRGGERGGGGGLAAAVFAACLRCRVTSRAGGRLVF